MDFVPTKSTKDTKDNDEAWQRSRAHLFDIAPAAGGEGDGVRAEIVSDNLADLIHWNKYGNDPLSKVNWDNYGKNKALDPADRDFLQRYKMEGNLLKHVTGTKEEDGSVTVSDYYGASPFAKIGNDGTLTPTLRQPPDSTENINTLLKSAAVYRAINGDSVQLGKGSDLETLMAAKAASLAGLTITNPPEKTLDQADPKLAHQMEQDWTTLARQMELNWTKHGDEYQQNWTKDGVDTRPEGLVTTPSALDKLTQGALSSDFSRSAQGASPKPPAPALEDLAPIKAPRPAP